MKISRILSTLAYIGILLFSGTMYAQSDNNDSGNVSPTNNTSINNVPSPENPPIEVNPTVRTKQTIRDLLPLYLTDKNGELVPALNWTPEELDTIIEQAQQNQQQNQIPDYICERLTLTGVQKGDCAEMELTLTFTIPEKPMVRIPLQLNGIVLLEPPKCSPNEFLIPQNDGGYVLYLKDAQRQNNLQNELQAQTEQVKPEETKQEEKTTTQSNVEKSPQEDKHDDKKEASEKQDTSSPDTVSDSSSTQSIPSESHSHQIALKILVPLKKTHSLYSMNLKLPQAVYSSISLDVPFTTPELRFTSNTVTKEKPESINDNKQTRLKAYALGTDFQMQWQKQAVSLSEKRIQEVHTDIYADISHGEILYAVNMMLQFSGDAPEKVTINLPLSAELIPVTTQQYSVQNPENVSEVNKAIVTFSENTKNSTKIAFQVRVPFNKLNLREWFNLMGFEVQDAAKQSGCVGVTADKDNQILWNPGQYVRRVDALPETFEGSYQYAFMFSEQPCQLLVRLVSGQTRINVQPRYVVTVNPEEMKLETTFKYNIRGNQTSWLDIDLQNWQLRTTKDIGPDNIFTEEIHEENGRVSVELSQTISDTIELSMTLYRKINSNDKELSFTLPRPVSKSSEENITIESGLLYVVSNTNVKLTPHIDNADVMIKQITTTSESQYSNTNETFCYRLDSLDTAFKASVFVFARKVDLLHTRCVRVANSTAKMEQKFDFSVQYEPLSQITFYGPESLAEYPNLEIKLNGNPLAIRTLTSKEQTRIVAMMDQPRIGRFTVTLSYDIPFDTSVTKSKFVMPLAQYENQGVTNVINNPTILLGLERVWELLPLETPWKLEDVNDTNVTTNAGFDIDISTSTDHSIISNDSTSVNVSNEDTITPLLNYMVITQESHTVKQIDNKESKQNDKNETVNETSHTPSSFSFSIAQRKGMVWNTLTVDRAWIQTWLTATRRQDAACFRFTSPHSQITLCLPPQTDMGSLELLLDNKSIEQFRIDTGQKVVLNVPTDKSIHTLEISYYFNRSKQGFDKENIALPYIKEAQWTRWFYWSVSVPQNIHLLMPPKQFNAEYTWQRQGPFFRRISVHSFEALEQWSGGRHLPAPPQGVNIYLFSGFGSIHEVELTLMNRTFLTFVASLIILVPGLILIHFKQLRHSWLLTIVAVILLCASFWEPELALVFLQASSLGLTLLTLSFLFRKKSPVMNSINDSTVFQLNGKSTQTK